MSIVDMNAKRAEYYDHMHHDHPSYWTLVRLNDSYFYTFLPCGIKILYRSYLDAKCESTNADRFDWENWQYMHRVVRSFF